MIFENIDTAVPKKQGNVGVARAIYEYTAQGYTVLVPFSDSDKYDLVVDDGKSLKRVQVKTSRCKIKDYKRPNIKRTGYHIQLATTGGNTQTNTRRIREDNDYDLLFVLTEDNRCWSIPQDALGGRGAINLGAVGPGAKYKEFEIK